VLSEITSRITKKKKKKKKKKKPGQVESETTLIFAKQVKLFQMKNKHFHLPSE